MYCFRTTFGLFGLSLHIFYLIIRDRAWDFLASEKEIFAALAKDVKSVAIAIDSSLLGVLDPPLAIFGICLCYYLQW